MNPSLIGAERAAGILVVAMVTSFGVICFEGRMEKETLYSLARQEDG